MATPSALVLACEECGEVPHRVLSGRVTGKDVVVFTGTVRCTSCGRVSSATVREARPVLIPVVVSEGERSERETIEFAPDELVSVGDRIEREGHLLRLTAIEVGERRVPSSRARDVRTMWAKRVDRIRVKVAVNKGNRTVSHEVEAAPDEEFEVGDVVDLGRERALIHRIAVDGGTLRRGTARAEEIVRVYAKRVRERTSH